MIVAVVSLALLAGCDVLPLSLSKGQDDTQPAIAAPKVAPERSSSGYQIIYGFKPSPDGSGPAMTLLAFNGMLYGTTVAGGTHGYGTVFVVSPTGKERVLHSFQGSPDDGSEPYAGLVEIDGKLYGTTKYGGIGGEGTFSGTVFEMTTSGNERVLHNFTGAPDGSEPLAALTVANGALLGTTSEGGSYTCEPSSGDGNGCGTVFKVTLSAKETILHRFQGVARDGSAPVAPLLAVGNEFYGTTSFGGTDNIGTIYEISAAGKEHIIHSFTGLPDSGSNTPDGKVPLDGLIIRQGILYGTTVGGGAGCFGYGCGTLFKVRTGEERVIYYYNSGEDYGWYPSTSVLAVNGSLYGTAERPDDGTVFEIRPSGKRPHLLHTFTGGADGSDPNGLTLLNGELYGTTSRAGNCDYHNDSGCGTVFRIAPR
jgi:uncharacterized repeat protein (TIGR03803 family)